MAVWQGERADFMRLAYEQALKSYNDGGLPISAAMVEHGTVIAAGHNRRVQDADPIAHGEMDCLRKAGRRRDYAGVTLYTTLSPCMMCAGTIVQFGIKSVVIGEARNFAGNVDFSAAARRGCYRPGRPGLYRAHGTPHQGAAGTLARGHRRALR